MSGTSRTVKMTVLCKPQEQKSLAIPEQIAISILAHDNAAFRTSGGLLNTIA